MALGKMWDGLEFGVEAAGCAGEPQLELGEGQASGLVPIISDGSAFAWHLPLRAGLRQPRSQFGL